MNKQKQEDLTFGDMNELEVLNILKNKYNTIRKLDKFHPMDYEAEECYIELKSRRNTHNKYITTMVGKNKIDYCRKQNKDAYFYFLFTDGLFYYKYDLNDNFQTTIGGRNDRGRNEYKLYYYIPVEKLIKFTIE